MRTHVRRSLGVLLPAEDRLIAVRLARRSGQYRAVAAASLRLQANLLGDPPEVVAGDLRSQLGEHGFAETRWLLAVPPSWLTTARVPLPPAATTGLADYAWLQAEQHLSVAVEQALLAYSPHTPNPDDGWLTLFTLKADRMDRVQQVLGAARLHLLGAVPAVILDPDAGPAEVRAALCAFSAGVVLQVTVGADVVLLRDLPVGRETPADGGGGGLAHVGRIALASLPPGVRTGIRRIERIGDATQTDSVLASCRQALSTNADTEPEIGPVHSSEEGRNRMAEALARVYSTPGHPLVFRRKVVVRPRGQINRRLLRAGIAGGVLLVAFVVWLLVVLFRAQALEREAAALQPRRDLVQSTRDQVRKLSQWYDRTPTSLDILKAITEAFPQQGTVWATGITITKGRTVNLVGKATDSAAWLAMQDALRQCPKVRDLRVSQIRSDRNGHGGISFVMTFTWIWTPKL